jgi:hypothetical protein
VNALVIFHIQDQNGHPVGNALLSATSPTQGPWQGLTNPCGEFAASLSPAHYDIAITAAGCAPNTLPADIQDSGIITHGIQRTFSPAPRMYSGNMCGSRVSGLPAVPDGSSDPSLVLSWFIDRYSQSDRHLIYQVWKVQGQTDVLISWPDSRGFGQSPQQFQATCLELIANGFYPCVFLSSKDYDPANDAVGTLQNIQPVLPFIVGLVPRVCIGWELSLWNSPTDVQTMIDALAPQFNAYGCKVYVHFAQGIFAWQQDGQQTNAFWNLNVGKLTGILHQRVQDPPDQAWDMPMYQARITDCLSRFSGTNGFVSDSGFGHPFDFIAMEITAEAQFNGQMDEATGNSWGQCALTTPAYTGPTGVVVSVQGSGNGQ